jgi:hypothetical protein
MVACWADYLVVYSVEKKVALWVRVKAGKTVAVMAAK